MIAVLLLIAGILMTPKSRPNHETVGIVERPDMGKLGSQGAPLLPRPGTNSTGAIKGNPVAPVPPGDGGTGGGSVIGGAFENLATAGLNAGIEAISNVGTGSGGSGGGGDSDPWNWTTNGGAESSESAWDW